MGGQSAHRAALLVVVSSAIFAGIGALIRDVSTVLPNEMVVFFRNLMGLIVLLPWLVRHGLTGLRTPRFDLHLVRSLSGLAGMYCYFYALSVLPLAHAVLLNHTAPLFVPFIAALWLRERVTPTLVGAAVIGFVGVGLILKPDARLATPAALIGLLAGAFSALAFTGIRRMAVQEPATRIVFYFSLISTVVSALPLFWAWTLPDRWALFELSAIGALASLAQVIMTRGYALAPATRVGPFGYSMVLFAAIIGWFGWGERPDVLAMVGAALICLSGMLAVRRGISVPG